MKLFKLVFSSSAAYWYLLIFIFAWTLTTSLSAQIRVQKGEYVLKTVPSLAATTQKQGLRPNTVRALSEGIKVVNAYRNGYALVRNESATGSADEIEDYKASVHEARCAEIMAEDPDVTACEPNYVYETSFVPNDTHYSKLWALDKISAPQAWDLGSGSKSVTVAIIDTGIDYTHPDLVDNMWVNPGEIPNNGIDDDANGYIDDVHGVNTFHGNGNPYDDNFHGTHCAGVIAATGNNKKGVVGLSSNTRLMAVKTLGAGGGGNLSSVIEGIYYAIDNGADIINASWGGKGKSKLLEEAIQAAGEANILFVTAAGNASTNNDIDPEYPASFNLDNIIAVAATDEDDELAFYSNYGKSVDVAAPGSNILSTIPGGFYATSSGTSMATPYVAALAAMLKSHDYLLMYWEVKDRIIGGAKPLASLSKYIASGRRICAYGAFASDIDKVEIEPSPALTTTFLSVDGRHDRKWITGKAVQDRLLRIKAEGEGPLHFSLSFSGGGVEAFQCDFGALPFSGQQTLKVKLNLLRLARHAKKVSIQLGDQVKTVKILRKKKKKKKKTEYQMKKLYSKRFAIHAARSCAKMQNKLVFD